MSDRQRRADHDELVFTPAPGSYRTRLSVDRALRRAGESNASLARRRRQQEPYFQGLGWIPPDERQIQIDANDPPAAVGMTRKDR